MDDRYAFTADQTKPQLAVIDTATNKVKTWIPLPALAYGTAPTHDGKWLLVALPSTGQVAVVDLQSMKVARTVDVPKSPQEILVRPDGEVAYVSCHESRKVAAIDLKTWKVDKIIEAGPMADGLAWARQELSDWVIERLAIERDYGPSEHCYFSAPSRNIIHL